MLDVLIPTKDRPGALAVTLTGLAAQSEEGFRVVVSDQSAAPAEEDPLVASAVRVLRHRGHPVEVLRHVPPRGMAEQRAFLLGRAEGRYALCLDDDVWLEPDAVRVLLDAAERLDCGFVGFAVQGLSYRDDVRPHELEPYEEWAGPVEPERVRRGTGEWRRHILHNAANPLHLAQRHARDGRAWRAYKVAWIGGCVLFHRKRLLDCGGFDFWTRVPPVHAGEDVVAQVRVMERYGGAGLLPSRAYHLELPTTVPDREVECYDRVIEDE
ncbi:GT2 family glycosyltransferase [Thermocatellispora tengchongensis]|uniref:GT2 family glycosyltransferase n=1 Tax=Thermocatellispora tengchongensis TaxID=1073253 RepID=A0A840PD13_9ACTN|nr:glycosyltransferase [Thermocatellispora tengchongensis]MBB5137122.1 GT2 family glycosyltransferase [Thermocatellispora tengchongensis]